MKKIISLILVVVLIASLCGCRTNSDNNSSGGNITVSTEEIVDIQTGQSDNTSENSSTQQTASNNTSVNNSSDNATSSENTSQTSSNASVQEQEKPDPNASNAPNVTLCAQVASNIYIVGGVCSTATEYITIGGASVNNVKVTPVKGKDNNYFITQVTINFSTIIEVQGKEKGKNLSDKVKKYVATDFSMPNLMTQGDYKPVFGLDNRMHYYSSILSYTLSNKVNSDIKQIGNHNISDTVKAAQQVGAEVVFLVVPSSAAVYPETVPTEYKAASGETLYKAFASIAANSGAKVIYPLDTMKAHKNDGDGYKIYSHTDSHWTTYGAYWGVNALMSHIAVKYPSAAPRTVNEMGFYTTELYAGDALFSFDDNRGFENYSQAAYTNGQTKLTGIKELTTLYNLKMPTDTLSKITRGKRSVYLTKDNEGAKTEINPNGAGLPSAVIVRDSFGRTAYDMINDRFSKVSWLAEGDYVNVKSEIYNNSPNYVIYIVSERNLLKVMLNNKDITLESMQ